VVAETVLAAGDTLERALRRTRLDSDELTGVIAALEAEVDVRRVRPGERLRVAWTEEGRLGRVSYWPSALEGHEVRLEGDAWTVQRVRAPVERRVAAVGGRLETSLFASMSALGETPVLTARVVELFEWDFDFAADCLPTDQFRVLVERQYVDGEFAAYGNILIAQYRSADRALLTAVAFEGPDGGVDYYDPRGRSVRKAFLRAPLDFTRITSDYSHARTHPILGGVRPHLAIDYGAPEGTPVRAVADGVVVRAGWNGGNGISVTLHHAHGYQTMYNHLSRADVDPGARVRQRQIIGRVGSTGLATGPHLDYRVIKDHEFVNPLDEKFVPGKPIPDAQREAFRGVLDALLERLDREAPFTPEGSTQS
jgi:murein DD-endopeptidase MepM/ murein hydrolase activator NlpD